MMSFTPHKTVDGKMNIERAGSVREYAQALHCAICTICTRRGGGGGGGGVTELPVDFYMYM